MSSSRKRRLIALVPAATALVLALTGCGGGNTGGDSNGKISVVASIDVWGSVLAAVGGDDVQVTSIIHDPQADPHSYETTPQDAIAMQSAQLTLENGGGYDDFFAKLAEQVPNAKKLVACDVGAIGTALNCDDNEHVWYSFPTMRKVADQIATELGQIRPADAQKFSSNAAAFQAKLAGLEAKATQAGDVHPGSKVIATEPVAHYLLATAGVTDATPPDFSKAIEDESDVPAAALAEVNSLIDGRQVNAVVNNAQTTSPVTRLVVEKAQRAGIPVVNVTETLPQGATDYISWMTGQVDALAKALNS